MRSKVRQFLAGLLTEPPHSEMPASSKPYGSDPRYGYLPPLSATQLLASESRQQLLRQLWENSLLPRAQYEQYFLIPLKQCVALMQQLPATGGGHHAVVGGMVDYTLKTLVYAVRLSRGYMLPPGASAEEQSAQSAAWGAVVFYAALFHSLSVLRQIEGEMLNGEIWCPGIFIPEQPYRFRFRENIPEGAGWGLGTMLGMRLLPGQVILWLSKTPLALDTLLSVIRGDPGHGDLIVRIVEDAIRHAGGKSLRTVLSPEMASPPTLSPGTENSPADVLLAQPLSPGGDLQIAAPGPLLSQVVDVPDALLPGVGLTGQTENLGQVPELVSSDRQGQAVSDPSVSEVLSLMGFDLSADDPPGPSGAELPEDSGPPSLTSDIPDPEMTPSQVTAEEDIAPGEDYGQQFVTWLSAQLCAGSVPVNTPEAQVHITGGLVFLPLPQIFYLFMKDRSYPPAVKTEIQRGFERMGLHYVRKGKGVFSCVKYEQVNRGGRYEKLSGYLIRAKLLYESRHIPDDSLFLFIS